MICAYWTKLGRTRVGGMPPCGRHWQQTLDCRRSLLCTRGNPPPATCDIFLIYLRFQNCAFSVMSYRMGRGPGCSHVLRTVAGCPPMRRSCMCGCASARMKRKHRGGVSRDIIGREVRDRRSETRNDSRGALFPAGKSRKSAWRVAASPTRPCALAGCMATLKAPLRVERLQGEPRSLPSQQCRGAGRALSAAPA